jgi:hypothetical protein
MMPKRLSAITAFLFCVSCAGHQKAVEQDKVPAKNVLIDAQRNAQKDAGPKQDESFDPRSVQDDGWIIRTRQSAATQKIFTGYSFDYGRNALIREAKEYVAMGYRVQLFVSTNYYEALTARDSAAVRLSDEIYFDYEQPYYKIRAGNFIDREKADEVRDRAKSLGYSDAWVVQTKVIIKETH